MDRREGRGRTENEVQAMKIPDAKAAADKKVGDARKIASMANDQSKEQKRGHPVHFAKLMDFCHLKNAELEPKLEKYKGRVVLRGDIVKDEFWLSCSIHTTRIICTTHDGRSSNGCNCKATRLRWTS